MKEEYRLALDGALGSVTIHDRNCIKYLGFRSRDSRTGQPSCRVTTLPLRKRSSTGISLD